ncbi:MAG: excinuclease ABC subunit UvrA [Clostridium sp.]|nr:excinuclease ABC subunit UvrA [Prevotella sp.]MCM1429238.1 excinuclease ABC subunit UvrA [Clostridium sp.]MCM1475729.1 excinuclease ABC subunit UvrA [Muribaculaceae bacterium]
MAIRNIEIKGARVNNLKNVDLNIPLNQFTVVTGVSGSGKSSMAFDTLYAEGQRRYVESLSSYARQFLGRMRKPDVDFIRNLPPAIAIEQKVNTRNPRSTVGTATEIYDYMRMLFARVGHTFSPVSGEEVKSQSVEDVVKAAMSLKEGTRVAIATDIQVSEGRTFIQQLEIYLKEGYSRLVHDGEFVDIAELLVSDNADESDDYQLLIDRLSISADSDEVSRLTDSVETAFFEGQGQCTLMIWTAEGFKKRVFSNKFSADGIDFRVPTDLMFNFNNPYGACRKCEGFGRVMGISEDLVIPDKTKSVYQDAVQCWRGEKMSEMKKYFVKVAPKLGFPIHTPYNELTDEQRDILWHGRGSWEGIDGFFRWIDENQYKIQYRVMKARYRGKTICPECGGTRLHKDVEYVKVGGRSITELVRMPATRLLEFFNNLQLSESDSITAARLLLEIRSRLEFLVDVGLGYLTLDRLSNTLSGGESQRINLATSLGSALVGSLYILDEPSIGLHSRDTERLIGVLKKLQRGGNTVVVVEHDEDIMLAADNIVDFGPDAGSLGGEVVFQGNLKDALKSDEGVKTTYTLDYLRGTRTIPVPTLRRPWKKYITVEGASEHNLKNIDVVFPLGVMTVVSGVSGSGKSTLVKNILYRSLTRRLGNPADIPGTHRGLSGDLDSIGAVEFIDQNPIGSSTRSNPVTYIKAYDDIRQLFASCQLAKQLGMTPSSFSFNVDGGRCEECKGEGIITIPMQFMADITVVCEECQGKRFKQEVLDVEYNGKNIYDVLQMTIDEAIRFFEASSGTLEKKIVAKLKFLQKVGLGYVSLGQSSSTLSGGENQRVKLAYFLSQERQPNTLFIFDEPTTGLHFHDISTLLDSLQQLVDRGHTVVIIEHNMEVIKSADYIIDIGPEGGEEGGNLVACGTPESVAESKESYTARYLREKLPKK